MNIGHTKEEIEATTKLQKDKIFPILQKKLNDKHKIVLDFGCGVGRFSEDLALLANGKTIAVDPIKKFLKLAPKSDKVDYLLMDETNIPVDDNSVDVIWICLVLGGIKDEILSEKILPEIDRVLKTGGLICLVENTEESNSGKYWYLRNASFYQDLFYFSQLEAAGNYWDVGQEITIFTGTKH